MRWCAASAEDYAAGQRLYGNVAGDLLWTFDKAAQGHGLQTTCGAGCAGLSSRNSQQGISPGWVDLYKADLSGQWLRLPSNVTQRFSASTSRPTHWAGW